MNVSYQLNMQIDTESYDLLDMKPSQFDPLVQQFSELGGMISDELGIHGAVEETARDSEWATKQTAMDMQLTEVAVVFQLLNIARKRAEFFNPDLESDSGAETPGGQDDTEQ